MPIGAARCGQSVFQSVLDSELVFFSFISLDFFDLMVALFGLSGVFRSLRSLFGGTH